MDVTALGIEGAWLFTPTVYADDRGEFCEWYRAADVAALTGSPMNLAQANCSVSRLGALRGVHYADLPPGQVKYVWCPHGAILDVAVDLRVGSPTFGAVSANRLDDVHRRAVLLAAGLGHAFLALSEGATAAYLCSAGYDPAREHATHPLDAALGDVWPADVEPVLSAKDAAAPTLSEAAAAGLLPSYDASRATYTG